MGTKQRSDLSRSFLSNVTFQELDIINPGAVEPESFDVVHIRLLLYHVRAICHFLQALCRHS